LKVVLQELKEKLESGPLAGEVAAISAKPARASPLKWAARGVAVISLAVAGWSSASSMAGASAKRTCLRARAKRRDPVENFCATQ
jgi:hypothetical protein